MPSTVGPTSLAARAPRSRRAVSQPQPQAAETLPRGRVVGSAVGGASGGFGRPGRSRPCPRRSVDAKRSGVGRSVSTRAQSRTERAAAGRLPGLPEGRRQQPQHRRVGRLGVARVHEPLGRQRGVALGERVLRRGHEALDAIRGGIGPREVDELQRAGRHRAHADREPHPRPLLDVVLVAGEVDAGDGADAPLRVRDAACVAVHDGVVGNARAERIVLCAVLRGGPRALLLLVGAATSLLAGLAGGGGRDLDRVARDASATGGLGELLKLVCRLVDRLKVALVLVLASGRRDVGMPALGHPAPRELHRALIERRLDLQQQKCLFDVEDAWHDSFTLAT